MNRSIRSSRGACRDRHERGPDHDGPVSLRRAGKTGCRLSLAVNEACVPLCQTSHTRPKGAAGIRLSLRPLTSEARDQIANSRAILPRERFSMFGNRVAARARSPLPNSSQKLSKTIVQSGACAAPVVRRLTASSPPARRDPAPCRSTMPVWSAPAPSCRARAPAPSSRSNQSMSVNR